MILENNSIGIYKMGKRNFVDKINIAGCAYLMTMDFNTFVSKYSSGWDENLDKEDINSIENYYRIVNGNCRKWFSWRKDGCEYIEIEQEYILGKNNTCSEGLIYVKGHGIQSLQHNIRKVLTGKYYVDIDIKNCHWNILLTMIKQYNDEYDDDTIKYTYIKEYCLNRNKVLKDENKTKHDLICLLNIDKYKTSSKFLKKLHRERMVAYEAFTDNDHYMKKYGNVETLNERKPHIIVS